MNKNLSLRERVTDYLLLGGFIIGGCLVGAGVGVILASALSLEGSIFYPIMINGSMLLGIGLALLILIYEMSIGDSQFLSDGP